MEVVSKTSNQQANPHTAYFTRRLSLCSHCIV